jgi:hypothetical protein
LWFFSDRNFFHCIIINRTSFFIDSVKRKLDPNKRKGTFTILGYDFMVDYDMTVWLIECNTNPCFDESSNILKTLLPRMLDDGLKLSVDKDFPDPLTLYQQ